MCVYILHIYDKNSSPNTFNEIHNLKTFKMNNAYRPNEVVIILILSMQIAYTVSKINIR